METPLIDAANVVALDVLLSALRQDGAEQSCRSASPRFITYAQITSTAAWRIILAKDTSIADPGRQGPLAA